MLRSVLLFSIFSLVLPHPNHHIDQNLNHHQNHFENGEHNPNFDHDAFLGSEEARAFDDLSPEQSRNRLSLIYDKIDRDGDGFVNGSELTKWIQWTQQKYITSDGQKQWRIHNPDGKEQLSWADYKRATYGFLENEARDSEEYRTYSRMMERDRRRWLASDQSGDDLLSLEEFQHFLHPEEISHMQDVVVIETIEDIDKNGDGKISEEEYISDLYRGEPGDEEPAWVQSERETFAGFRDLDKDGFLDHGEVKQWVMPKDYDHAGAESAHLIHSADTNKDGKLTKQEVLDKYEVFVGSQATDFGEALTRHEEF